MNFKLSPPGQQPIISYHPSLEQYQLRTSLRLQADPTLPQTTLPSGFPERLEGPLVWKGSDFTDESQWVVELSDEDIKEVDAALEHWEGLNLPMGYLSKETFPLPTLSPKLQSLTERLYNSTGFFVLRSLPLHLYSKIQALTAFTGISSHLAPLRGRQSGTNAMLAHITDLRSSHQLKELGNAAYTTDKQVFHTDAGDLIGLLALETAAEGGTSLLSSSWRVYNELAESRPDLVCELAGEWVLDNFDGTYRKRPLLFWENGKMVLQYSRRHFTGYGEQKRNKDIPSITEAQAEALDALHFTAERYCLKLDFRKGDMQFINSLALVHAREGFRDFEQKKRHLVRLWLRNEEVGWDTPKLLRENWGRIYGVEKDSQRFPVEAEVRKREGGGPR